MEPDWTLGAYIVAGHIFAGLVAFGAAFWPEVKWQLGMVKQPNKEE